LYTKTGISNIETCKEEEEEEEEKKRIQGYIPTQQSHLENIM
jgi:hypothetical protein